MILFDAYFFRSDRNGFTYIEILVALAITIIVSSVAILLLNPGAQLAKARNTEREADVYAILNSIGQKISDNRGVFSCSSGSIPASSTRMASGAPYYDIAPCLVPTYLATLPYDPLASPAHWASTTDYDTFYAITKSATSGRITISALNPELGEVISATR